MYNEKIEELIRMALIDGVLTDKERQILLKRAVNEGIDPDEFEMVLDARIVELQQSQPSVPPPPPSPLMSDPSPAASAKPKTKKFGDLYKCPNCGAVVEGGIPRCGACGYAFVGIKANSSSQELAKQLQAIDKSFLVQRESLVGTLVSGSTKANQHVRARAGVIRSFPIPSAKEDLLEFVISMRANWLNSQPVQYGIYTEKSAYKAKYDECIEKIRLYFPSDPTFKTILLKAEEDKNIKKTLQERFQEDPMKYILWANAIVWGFLIFMAIITSLME